MPSGTPRSVRERARTEINFVGPPTLPFSCSAGGTASAGAFNDGLKDPRRSGLAELIVLYEGTILAVVYDDAETGRYRCGLLKRRTGYWKIHIHSFPIVSSRVSFSARPLSDIPASRVPSVAAAAEFLYSSSSRRRFWHCVSARYCCEERNF